MRGHDESVGSVNPGVFRGLIDFASKLDSDLKTHIENSTVFKGYSKTIQNDILSSVLKVYRDRVILEISKAPFVAVMADDTTDVSEVTQMVIVVRYLLEGKLVERFWGYFNPDRTTADGLSNCLMEQLQIILGPNTDKLIAQTFDGASVMKGNRGGVQVKVRAVYKNAWYVHCYAHQLNLILSKAGRVNKGSRIFFSNIDSIPTFFSDSPARLKVLKKHMEVRVPRPSGVRWNFHERTVSTVHKYFEPLVNCMEELQSGDFTNETVSKAGGFLNYFQQEKFLFWLKLFSRIMQPVQILYNQMQARTLTIDKAKSNIAAFKQNMEEIRNSSLTSHSSQSLRAEAIEVLDNVISDLESRFSFSGHLILSQLFDKTRFAEYKDKFPEDIFALVPQFYPMLDQENLRTELEVFYGNLQDVHYTNMLDLMNYFVDRNLSRVFPEVLRLLHILITIPMTTSEAERCFSTLKRIKNFLRSTMSQDRLNSLAVLSINKDIVTSYPNFKNDVISHFIQDKNRRMDFVLRT